MPKKRLAHLERFYSVLNSLREHQAARTLGECVGRLDWPRRGVYFFMEEGESRTDSGAGPRIVRVGTHALKPGSTTQLSTRLAQHRGQHKSGGGNHRGSIFRLIVGSALIRQRGYEYSTWGVGNTAPREVRADEFRLECEVSKVIGAMPFLWLDIDDEPGAGSLRGYVERNAIALLSNFKKPPLDAQSSEWLGHHCDRERVRMSGLWNSNHVEEDYDPAFLDRIETLTRHAETAT